jgi:Fe-S-cluster containining protein
MTRSSVVRRLQVYATPARAAFECTTCGNCCHGWRVSVDRKTYDRLERLLVAGDANPKGHAVENCLGLLPTPTDDLYASLEMVEGHCVFLDDDQLCYLHKHFGESSKPATCRRFPSTTIATPEGRFLHPTFACKGMAIALGKTAGAFSVTREGSGLRDAGALVSATLTRDSLLHFGPARTKGGVTSAGLGELMRGLRSLLKLEGASTEALLLAGRLWLEELSEPQRALDEDDVRKNHERALKDRGAALLTRAAQMPRSPELHMDTLRMIIALRLERRSGLFPESQEWFDDVMGRYLLDTQPEASAKCFHDDLAAIYLPAQPETGVLLRSYVAEKLYYHPNCLTLGVLAGYHSLLYLFALIRLFVVGRASSRGLALTSPLVLTAIQIVEREFDHTENLFDFWHSATHTETLKPLFASVLLGG